MMVLGLIMFVAAGFGIAAIARGVRGPGPIVSQTPIGPAPPPLSPPHPPTSMTLGITVGPDGAGVSTHTLTPADVAVPPFVFALAAGYSSVDAMVDANPHLRLVDAPAEGWPPQAPFSYVVKGTTSIYAFSPTGKFDEDYGPTFKSGDAEWVFPTWSEATARTDIKMATPVYEGHAPVASSKGVPVVYGSPLATAPFVAQRALIPWTVGTVIQLPQGVA